MGADARQLDYGEEAALGAAVESLLAHLREDGDPQATMIEIEAYLARYGLGPGTGRIRADACYRLLRGLAEHILLLDHDLSEAIEAGDESAHEPTSRLRLSGTALLRKIALIGMQEAASEGDAQEARRRWKNLHQLFREAPGRTAPWNDLLLLPRPTKAGSTRELEELLRALEPLEIGKDVLQRFCGPDSIWPSPPDPMYKEKPMVLMRLGRLRPARRALVPLLAAAPVAAVALLVWCIWNWWKPPETIELREFAFRAEPALSGGPGFSSQGGTGQRCPGESLFTLMAHRAEAQHWKAVWKGNNENAILELTADGQQISLTVPIERTASGACQPTVIVQGRRPEEVLRSMARRVLESTSSEITRYDLESWSRLGPQFACAEQPVRQALARVGFELNPTPDRPQPGGKYAAYIVDLSERKDLPKSVLETCTTQIPGPKNQILASDVEAPLILCDARMFYSLSRVTTAIASLLERSGINPAALAAILQSDPAQLPVLLQKLSQEQGLNVARLAEPMAVRDMKEFGKDSRRALEDACRNWSEEVSTTYALQVQFILLHELHHLRNPPTGRPMNARTLREIQDEWCDSESIQEQRAASEIEADREALDTIWRSLQTQGGDPRNAILSLYYTMMIIEAQGVEGHGPVAGRSRGFEQSLLHLAENDPVLQSELREILNASKYQTMMRRLYCPCTDKKEIDQQEERVASLRAFLKSRGLASSVVVHMQKDGADQGRPGEKARMSMFVTPPPASVQELDGRKKLFVMIAAYECRSAPPLALDYTWSRLTRGELAPVGGMMMKFSKVPSTPAELETAKSIFEAVRSWDSQTH